MQELFVIRGEKAHPVKGWSTGHAYWRDAYEELRLGGGRAIVSILPDGAATVYLSGAGTFQHRAAGPWYFVADGQTVVVDQPELIANLNDVEAIARST